jgi:hypothetical protein
MRALLASFVVTMISAQAALAQEVKLRCDSRSADGDVVILSINPSNKSVHVGTNPNTGWFIDNEQFRGKTEESREATSGGFLGGMRAYLGCSFSIHQFVRISDDFVEYGEKETNINRCGYPDDRHSMNDPGERVSTDTYKLNLITGVLSAKGSSTLRDCREYTPPFSFPKGSPR